MSATRAASRRSPPRVGRRQPVRTGLPDAYDVVFSSRTRLRGLSARAGADHLDDAVQLAIGDASAAAPSRGAFTPEFRVFHPGGKPGLSLRTVRDKRNGGDCAGRG